MTPDERLAADVFGLTYREYEASRGEDYRLRLIAPAAMNHLRASRVELWSTEKLADYLHTDIDEAALRLRRFIMSERVNAGRDTPERISRLFAEWLARFDLDERERKELSRDLSRLLSSQLHAAAESGETLDELIAGLEKTDGNSGGPSAGKAGGPDDAGPKPWGPQWKD
jgi:hypothetical protein